MKKNNPVKISLSTFLLALTLLVIVILAMAYYIYTQKANNNKKIADLEENTVIIQSTINDLQGKLDDISNPDKVSYIILTVEDTSENELSSKMKLITDENEIKSLMNIIDNAKEYKTTSDIPDFGDMPSSVEVFLANGEHYTIIAGDDIDDDGNIVNLMAKWYKQDESNKILFKVDTKLAEYIDNLYNNSDNSYVSEEKEIYRKVSAVDMDESDLEYYNERFIVLENGRMYFSNDLSDKILEGTYLVNSDNTIDYTLFNETQDYSFYTASTYKIENINGKKTIVVDNDPNGTMYFQKVD